MPRAKAGLGRTGSKHKKVSQFNIHRDIKGVDDVFKQEAPSNLVPDESTPESAKSASVVPLSSLSASASNLSFNQYREPAGKGDYSSEGSGEDDSEHDSTASHAGCPPMPSLPEQSAQPSSAPSQLKPSPAPQPKRPPRKTAYAGRRHWHTGVKRLYGSKEAVEAINAAVECEYSAWWADAPDSGDDLRSRRRRHARRQLRSGTMPHSRRSRKRSQAVYAVHTLRLAAASMGCRVSAWTSGHALRGRGLLLMAAGFSVTAT